MSLTITYQTLFEVRIIHHYFLNLADKVYERMTQEEKAEVSLKYDCHDFFDIRPTEATQRFLSAHGCLFRQVSTGFLAGIKTEPGSLPGTGKPFINPDLDAHLDFIVTLTDPDFLNYTALPLTKNEGTLYYFDNRTDFRLRIAPNLSSVPPQFKPGDQYLPGEILVNNAANPTRLWCARVKTSASTASPDWMSEKKSEGFPVDFVNRNDRLRIVRGLLRYQVTVPGAEPEVTVRNSEGTLVTPRVTTYPGDRLSFSIDMTGFPDGIYTARFETPDALYSEDVTFFLLLLRETPFAVIRLYVTSNTPEFNLLTPAGDLTDSLLILRFRNRHTHWKFVGPTFNDDSVTPLPLPLTRLGMVQHVTVPDKNGVPVDDLPNPTRKMIRTAALTSATEIKYYSDIHIH